ncbi:hypothetical protein [Sphingorhabdus sp.]|uniref:hypothetical protein n=1 Tax=Sphingorhabdus sp. TaxID=1902408 RepID=UPI003919F2BB
MAQLTETSSQGTNAPIRRDDTIAHGSVGVDPLLSAHGVYKGVVFSFRRREWVTNVIIGEDINYVRIATPAAFPNVLKLIGTSDDRDLRSHKLKFYENEKVELKLLNKHIPESIRGRLSGRLDLPCRISRHGVLSILMPKQI